MSIYFHLYKSRLYFSTYSLEQADDLYRWILRCRDASPSSESKRQTERSSEGSWSQQRQKIYRQEAEAQWQLATESVDRNTGNKDVDIESIRTYGFHHKRRCIHISIIAWRIYPDLPALYGNPTILIPQSSTSPQSSKQGPYLSPSPWPQSPVAIRQHHET